MKTLSSLLPKSAGTILSAFVLAFAVFMIGDAVMAQDLISPSDNPSSVSSATGGESSFRSIVLTIVNFILSFLGIIAVLFVIYGGFLYVTSAGNSEKVDQGKKIITYAVVGIVIILISFALINTILGAANPGAQS